ncbi:hypothetical protein [Nocardioides cynanchi]|uniref:hypothetical protein n=1 Tax=Nocardioides cynanchi TaxID=2558918 RepID=UPI001246A87D|nr:hypothetical protein [Nocardioides cynanchi]
MSSPLGRAIEAMHVSATTPNGQVAGEVNGWYDVRITCAAGYPERVGEAELAAQVERLARLLFAARMATYNRLVEEHLPQPVLPLSDQDRAYEEDVSALASTGESSDGSIRISGVAMTHWTVHIRPGLVDGVGGERVAALVTEAANAFVRDRVAGVRRLKNLHYVVG